MAKYGTRSSATSDSEQAAGTQISSKELWFIRRLARDYVARCPGLDASAVGPVVARWGARLSALLLRGNAAVMRAGGLPRPATLGVDAPGSASLCHSLPVGECAYELLVG